MYTMQNIFSFFYVLQYFFFSHPRVKVSKFRLKFFLKRKVYSYSVSQTFKLKSKIFHDTGYST